ncbi:DUF4168 domain-containing protein [Moorena bouillonii]|uniref:DUF4168 domain-containing protein n=1 Tax=Moorena bouillonii PNG TaxID=568701 RepID=A0A1U7N0V3_9CYAN|nr:DUF4168 domain-containing protein [Moorena bouillonii]OLT59572.1 hypothetical protein BJP37_11570 [Moorena bouillonii PNG]
MTKFIYPLGWLAGMIVVLVGCSSSPDPDPTAAIPTVASSEVKSQELKNYAKAVLAIDQNRQGVYEDIQEFTKDKDKIVPEINCTQVKTIAALRRNIRDLAVNYCKRSKTIAESHDLTISRFNSITVSAQSDQKLQRRIHNELVRLQQN